MQPSRILPDLQCSLLCEDIRQEASGNFILLGVINFVRVPQLPVTAFKICVFNRWTAGVGQFTESVRLLAPDQTTVLRKGEVGLCGTCMDARGMADADCIEGARRGTMAQLADWTMQAEKVLVF